MNIVFRNHAEKIIGVITRAFPHALEIILSCIIFEFWKDLKTPNKQPTLAGKRDIKKIMAK